MAMIAPVASCNSRVGSARGIRPKSANDGPRARMRIFLPLLPPMINPPIREVISSPRAGGGISTRVERLSNEAGAGVGLRVTSRTTKKTIGFLMESRGEPLVYGRPTQRSRLEERNRALAAQFEHPQDWRFSAFAQLLGENNFGIEIEECGMCLFERVHFHEPALGAGAPVGRTRDEELARYFLFQPMQHAGFCDDDDFLGRRFLAERNHLLGRTNFIGQETHRVRTLGMRDDRRAWILGMDGADTARRELDVDVTVT